ncbi:MAG: M56 family metallopeptidase [Pseudomonadota bacterium]
MSIAFLIEIAVKSLALSGLALCLLHLFRGRSAAEKSFLAHTCLLGILVLPFVSTQLPDLQLAVLPATEAPPLSAGATAPPRPGAFDAEFGAITPSVAGDAAARSSLPWMMIAILVPTIALLVGIVLGLLQLRRLRHRATVLQDETWLKALARAQDRMSFKEGTALLVSGDINSPVSWGLVRPIILLDHAAVGDVDRAEAIIAHELAHVVRMDWIKMILARMVVAIFWFNPLVWRLASEAHQLREESADDAVLRAAVGQRAYASLLVDVVRHQQAAAMTPAHGVAPGADSLKRRVKRILDNGQPRNTANRAWATISFSVLGAVLVPLAMVTPVEAQSIPPLAQLPENQSSASTDVSTRVRGEPTIDNIVDMRIHGVSPAWIGSLEDAYPGLAGLTYDQLIELRIHGVDAAFLRSLSTMGFAEPRFQEIRDAAIHGVTPGYVESLADAGYTNLSLSELARLRIHGVSPTLINGLAEAGFDDLSVSQLREAGVHGLTPGFIARMKQMWTEELTFRDVINFRIHGVSADFIEAFRRVGYQDLTPEEAIRLRIHGINASDVTPLDKGTPN